MGRQWLHSKRAVASLKKSKATGNLVREIMIAARAGGADPSMNASLAAAIEKARKESVPRDVIQRAAGKGAGVGGEKMTVESVLFEGYAPHKVPVIIEAVTDNPNRTVPEIRVLFRKGQLGAAGSNKFLFDAVGLVEAFHADPGIDPEEAAIEAGANEVESLTTEQNDDIPEGVLGVRFITDRTVIHEVSSWLTQNGWTIFTSEHGNLPKNYPELNEKQRHEVGEFLQLIDDHDDVHRVWAAVK